MCIRGSWYFADVFHAFVATSSNTTTFWFTCYLWWLSSLRKFPSFCLLISFKATLASLLKGNLSLKPLDLSLTLAQFHLLFLSPSVTFSSCHHQIGSCRVSLVPGPVPGFSSSCWLWTKTPVPASSVSFSPCLLLPFLNASLLPTFFALFVHLAGHSCLFPLTYSSVLPAATFLSNWLSIKSVSYEPGTRADCGIHLI